jgi:hypothetical protein
VGGLRFFFSFVLPVRSLGVGRHITENLPVTEPDRLAIAYRNAETLLDL